MVTSLRRNVAAGLLTAACACAPVLAWPAPSYLECDLPPRLANEPVFVLPIRGGGTVPTVSLVGQYETTVAAIIEIERDPGPFYLIIESLHEPTIVVMTGSTDRITHVVMASEAEAEGPEPAAGVVGVSRDKVHFLKRGTCLSLFGRPGNTWEGEEVIAETLGVFPRVVGAGGGIERTLLPSGVHVLGENVQHLAPAGFDPETWWWATRFRPAGIIRINAGDVVSERKAESYNILPTHYGLAQLVDSGVLERLDRDNFRTLKPLSHYPPGLKGSQAVRLLISKRFPEPEGDPGDACVVWEETGEEIEPATSCKLIRGPR